MRWWYSHAARRAGLQVGVGPIDIISGDVQRATFDVNTAPILLTTSEIKDVLAGGGPGLRA